MSESKHTPLIWVTNAHKDTVCETRHQIGWPVIEIGEPKATDFKTIEQLRQLGMLGLYRPDESSVETGNAVLTQTEAT